MSDKNAIVIKHSTIFRCYKQFSDAHSYVIVKDWCFYWNILEETGNGFWTWDHDYTLEFGPYTMVTAKDTDSYGDRKVGSYQANSN